MPKAYIPAKENIHSTSDVDGVNTSFGYWGPLSYPMRRRLDMGVNDMANKPYHKILEAGYGCGIMLPELYKNLSKDGVLYGIDVHGEDDQVKEKMCATEGMDPKRVDLRKSEMQSLPFDDDSFDLVISISVLEHIHPSYLPACLNELKRVAKPGADIILGFPTDCIFIRLLAWIQKQNLKENHPSTHLDIFKAIKDQGFEIKKQCGFPMFWGPLTLHYSLKVEPV